jgi:hypothetical protein
VSDGVSELLDQQVRESESWRSPVRHHRPNEALPPTLELMRTAVLGKDVQPCCCSRSVLNGVEGHCHYATAFNGQ